LPRHGICARLALVPPDAPHQTSTITWGHALHGELGYGAGGKKSSANPEKVASLEGIRALGVSAGVAHMLILADANSDKLAALPAWSPPADAPAATAADEPDGKKRKAPAAAAGGKKRAA
jgi:hypothetical protein